MHFSSSTSVHWWARRRGQWCNKSIFRLWGGLLFCKELVSKLYLSHLTSKSHSCLNCIHWKTKLSSLKTDFFDGAMTSIVGISGAVTVQQRAEAEKPHYTTFSSETLHELKLSFALSTTSNADINTPDVLNMHHGWFSKETRKKTFGRVEAKEKRKEQSIRKKSI